jgi:hypothetical protein
MPSSRCIAVAVIIAGMLPALYPLRGQETPSGLSDNTVPLIASPGDPEELGSSLTIGTDLVSSYIWRGMRQGAGPHLQPVIEYSNGNFTVGVWSTFDLHGYREADLYLAVDIPGGFNLSLQDYWMAYLPWSDFSTASGSHVLEAAVGYESDHVCLNLNYVFNEAGGAGSSGNDLYAECRLLFGFFSVYMGAGNGWHTEDGVFAACALGFEVSRDIEVSDTFSLPVTASVVYNPDLDKVYLAAAISFSITRDN